MEREFWFNAVTKEFKNEPGIQATHKTFVVNQYKRLLTAYPELKHDLEFDADFPILPPKF